MMYDRSTSPSNPRVLELGRHFSAHDTTCIIYVTLRGRCRKTLILTEIYNPVALGETEIPFTNGQLCDA